jgi:signal peptidase I
MTLVPAMAAVVVALLLAAAGGTARWLRRRFVVVNVEGQSMEPVLHGQDRVVVRRTPARRLRIGDIVVFERPYRNPVWAWRPLAGGLHDRRWIIKRLAALPGDPLPAGVPADPAQPADTAEPAGVVPAGHAVLLGDNADASVDSRTFGPVPLDRVLGVARRRYAEDGPISSDTRAEGASSAASSRANRGVR